MPVEDLLAGPAPYDEDVDRRRTVRDTSLNQELCDDIEDDVRIWRSMRSRISSSSGATSRTKCPRRATRRGPGPPPGPAGARRRPRRGPRTSRIPHRPPGGRSCGSCARTNSLAPHERSRARPSPRDGARPASAAIGRPRFPCRMGCGLRRRQLTTCRTSPSPGGGRRSRRSAGRYEGGAGLAGPDDTRSSGPTRGWPRGRIDVDDTFSPRRDDR